MLGLINQREVHLLNQDGHVKIEPLDSVQNMDMVKSSKYLSISRKFVLFPKNLTDDRIEQYFPVYPNEQVIHDFKDQSNYQVSYVINKAFVNFFRQGHHAASFINELTSHVICNDQTCTFILLLHNHAIVMTKRLNDYLFYNIFEFDQAEELLYYITQLYLHLNIDREVGRIVFMGEIDTESKIYDLFSVYFRHLEIDKSRIFKSLIES